LTENYSNEAEELVIGEGVTIGPGSCFAGGRIEICDNSTIGRNVEITVTERMVLGKGSKVGDFSIIRGRRIETGREFYSNHHAEIGGGSCFEQSSSLTIGYWFHFGSYAIVNTARRVEVGHEVGLGRMTNVYTHGAYLSEIDGFPVKFAPVKIGDRVWIPSATVNPGVTIGSDVVIGAGSLVTRDLPSGCLAMGTPCRVVKEQAFPVLADRSASIRKARDILVSGGVESQELSDTWRLVVKDAEFDLQTRTIAGTADEVTERARSLLRRHGIRFKVEVVNGSYCGWS